MSMVFQIFRKEKYFCMKGCMSKKIVEKKRAKKKNESQRRHSEINLHNMLLTFPQGKETFDHLISCSLGILCNYKP